MNLFFQMWFHESRWVYEGKRNGPTHLYSRHETPLVADIRVWTTLQKKQHALALLCNEPEVGREPVSICTGFTLYGFTPEKKGQSMLTPLNLDSRITNTFY